MRVEHDGFEKPDYLSEISDAMGGLVCFHHVDAEAVKKYAYDEFKQKYRAGGGKRQWRKEMEDLFSNDDRANGYRIAALAHDSAQVAIAEFEQEIVAKLKEADNNPSSQYVENIYNDIAVLRGTVAFVWNSVLSTNSSLPPKFQGSHDVPSTIQGE